MDFASRVSGGGEGDKDKPRRAFEAHLGLCGSECGPEKRESKMKHRQAMNTRLGFMNEFLSKN